MIFVRFITWRVKSIWYRQATISSLFCCFVYFDFKDVCQWSCAPSGTVNVKCSLINLFSHSLAQAVIKTIKLQCPTLQSWFRLSSLLMIIGSE